MKGVDPNDARRVAARYVCSDCFEGLNVWYDWKTRTSEVRCETPGCMCNGFIRLHTVETLEQKSLGELLDAKYLLRRAGAIATPRIDTARVLAELGF
jgi:hypothetical protein